jgi:hypothetical protein
VIEGFAQTGVVRLPGAFDRAAAMREAVLEHAAAGTNWRGLNRSPIFQPMVDNDAVRAALDEIFGAEKGWRRPRPGAQILFSEPEPGPWVLPDSWHIDAGFEQPTWPVPAVKLFAFIGEVGPFGGGTMVLTGTHRLVDRYRQGLPGPVGAGRENWRRFMRHDPWLARLLDGAELPDHGRSLVGEAAEIDGVPVEVVELTGSPGDVVLTHLHVFHARSPNVSPATRLMLGKEVSRDR